MQIDRIKYKKIAKYFTKYMYVLIVTSTIEKHPNPIMINDNILSHLILKNEEWRKNNTK